MHFHWLVLWFAAFSRAHSARSVLFRVSLSSWNESSWSFLSSTCLDGSLRSARGGRNGTAFADDDKGKTKVPTLQPLLYFTPLSAVRSRRQLERGGHRDRCFRYLRRDVRMIGLLELLLFELILVFPRDVSSDRVVPGERPRTERTRHPDTLVTLPYVSAQIRLVTIQSIAERTLEFFTCKEKNLRLCRLIVYKFTILRSYHVQFMYAILLYSYVNDELNEQLSFIIATAV